MDVSNHRHAWTPFLVDLARAVLTARAPRKRGWHRRRPEAEGFEDISCLVWSDLVMEVKTISEAKAQLSKLVKRVLAGEEVVIGRAGKPVAKLVPFDQQQSPRRPGLLAGRIEIADDFDELPNDLAEAFGVVP